ncbi:MAG: alternative ribosome rescue aminoacyl-tRNA hydrolase ArfB, partial [Dermatophilaceae bacterium]
SSWGARRDSPRWCGRRFRTAAHQAKGSPAAASAVGGPVRRRHGSQPVAPACSTHGLPALVGSWQAGQLSGAIRIRGTLSIPAAELAWRFSRSSGPGGQHVNTADSRVELLFDLASSPSIPPVLKARAIQRLGPRLRDGLLVVVASRQRSQLRNRVAARQRLGEILSAATDPPPRQRRLTRPTRTSDERRIEAKKRSGSVKRQCGRRKHLEE